MVDQRHSGLIKISEKKVSTEQKNPADAYPRQKQPRLTTADLKRWAV